MQQKITPGDYDLSDLKAFVKGMFQQMKGMINMDSNRMTCLYFLTVTSSLLEMNIDK